MTPEPPCATLRGRWTAVAAAASLLLVPVGLGACSTTSGPIEPRTEDWEDLLDDSLEAIERELIAKVGAGAQRKREVAFTGLEHYGGNPMYDFQNYANAHIQTRLQNSELFTVIDQRVIESGMRAGRIEVAADIQYIEKTRQEFLSHLHNKGAYPEYLLYARYTTLGAGSRDADYMKMKITFTLSDTESGESIVEKHGETEVER